MCPWLVRVEPFVSSVKPSQVTCDIFKEKRFHLNSSSKSKVPLTNWRWPRLKNGFFGEKLIRQAQFTVNFNTCLFNCSLVWSVTKWRKKALALMPGGDWDLIHIKSDSLKLLSCLSPIHLQGNVCPCPRGVLKYPLICFACEEGNLVLMFR